MKRILREIGGLWLAYVVLFQVFKVIFLLWYGNDAGASFSDAVAVLRHGFSMDMTAAGYAAALPSLLSIAAVWVRGHWLETVRRVVLAVIAVALSIIYVADLRLYGFWNMRLDTTPIFYLMSSPVAAMASAGFWDIALGLMAIAALSAGIWWLTVRINISGGSGRIPQPGLSAAVGVLLLGLMFIAIRGGVSVSTMNLSRAYFSENRRLNQAAVNPVFNLLYSATHTSRYGNQYQYFDEATLARHLDFFNNKVPDSIPGVALTDSRPDVYLIILESFSAQLMPSLGGAPVALRLDSLASEGVLFTNAYAGSFRTDRALPTILNGIPAQPSMSIMKFVDKTAGLPSLARSLRVAGYEPSYYYGGDINFTNMNALLVNSGYGLIVHDKDFALAERASKWGAPDGPLFRKAIADIEAASATAAPRFVVIQTSSSHEPFDVPYSNPAFADVPQLNAFAYADSCAGAFVRHIAGLGDSLGRPGLFVLVPDHWGCWPEGLQDPLARHHIPVVLAGSGLHQRGVRVDRLMSQHDLAATLLGLLQLDHTEYSFSRDVLADGTEYAVFSEPHLTALLTPADTIVIDPDADRVILGNGERQDVLKAYFQNLYRYLEDI